MNEIWEVRVSSSENIGTENCYFKKFNSLVLEFYPQSFLCQSDCLINLHNISSEWLDLFSLFFAQQFSIMIETNWINFGDWWVLVFFVGVAWSQACFFIVLLSGRGKGFYQNYSNNFSENLVGNWRFWALFVTHPHNSICSTVMILFHFFSMKRTRR